MKVTKVKTSNIFEDYHSEEIASLQNELINIVLIQQDKFIENILRNHVNPPIKGEITKGKIKWRGLEILHDINYSKLWIRQRGKDIPIYFDYGFNRFL